MLEAHHLVKRFFGVAAVDDISFAVSEGEILGYLGPNGSGKTMTARLVIASTVNSVVEQILAYREKVGPFGTRSMELMAEKVMPKLNAALKE